MWKISIGILLVADFNRTPCVEVFRRISVGILGTLSCRISEGIFMLRISIGILLWRIATGILL